jgi:hypothetical protein
MSDNPQSYGDIPNATDPTELHKFLLKHEVGLVWEYIPRVNADVGVRKYDDYCKVCFCAATCLQDTKESCRVWLHGIWVWAHAQEVIASKRTAGPGRCDFCFLELTSGDEKPAQIQSLRQSLVTQPE